MYDYMLSLQEQFSKRQSAKHTDRRFPKPTAT